MTNESDDSIRDSIHVRAAAHAEATVYTMGNSYLSQVQKAQVESVYQFPFGVMSYTFGIVALFYDQSLYSSFLNASFIGALAWVIARYTRGKIIAPIGFFTAGWIATAVDLALAAYALYLGRWGVAALLGLTAFGITSVAMLPMWLWSLESRRIAAKYMIAKRMWGVVYPFEADLSR